jgi:tetratricopeptide (TPR) repeat protein
LNELRVLVEPIYSLGEVMELTGDYARALELYSEGLEIAMAIGDRWFAALCLTCRIGLVGITQMIAKPEITHERLQSVVSEWRAIGDPRFTAIGLNSLYWSALRLGRYEEARAALEESIELSISVGDRWVLGFAYRGLGIIAQAQSEQTKAVEMFRKSLDIFTELGARQEVARALADMSRSIFALGNDAEAGRGWHESLRIAMETRGIFIALEALVGLASLQAKHSDMEHALELLLIVLNHPVITHETRKRAARLRTELEAQLTPLQIETIKVHVGEITFESVVEGLLR